MQNIINSGNIISYDDMMYNSGPTKFNSFINDEYNMIHNTFNPSLSSMILLMNPKSAKKDK